MKKFKKVIVIIPAYNEEGRIAETISAFKDIREKFRDDGITLLLYVIDDGSADATKVRAQEAGADRILHHKVNMGLGAAVRTGLAAGRSDGADVVIKFDADLQHDPKDIAALIQPILNDEADVVYGNRFERIEYEMPPVRRVGNIFFYYSHAMAHPMAFERQSARNLCCKPFISGGISSSGRLQLHSADSH